MNALIAKTVFTASAALALGMSLLPGVAQAGEVGNRIGQEQARINQGVRDGQMTFGEYARTESTLDRIAAQRRFDLRVDGGHLTPWQRLQLNRELNGDSRAIYFDKHNWARQPGAPLI